MPAIVSGTVVRWDVDRATDPAHPTVVFVESRDVSIYVSDGSQQNSATAIIARYISEEQPRLGYAKLIQDAQSGLLEVLGIRSLAVTAPAVPRAVPAAAAPAGGGAGPAGGGGRRGN
jgi:hypothetical protein